MIFLKLPLSNFPLPKSLPPPHTHTLVKYNLYVSFIDICLFSYVIRIVYSYYPLSDPELV